MKHIYRQYLLVGLSTLIILPSACMIGGNTDSAQPIRENANDNDGSGHKFIYTEQEKAACDASQWSDLRELIRAALRLHRGALFNLAHVVLGKDKLREIYASSKLTIADFTHEEFTNYITQSASLGFAPALHLLSQKYTWQEDNTYLSLVYINICIELGHTELLHVLLQAKHILRRDGCIKLIHEIERITQEKMAVIDDNCKKLKSSKDPLFVISSLTEITLNDKKYTMDYWQNLQLQPDDIITLKNLELKPTNEHEQQQQKMDKGAL